MGIHFSKFPVVKIINMYSVACYLEALDLHVWKLYYYN